MGCLSLGRSGLCKFCFSLRLGRLCLGLRRLRIGLRPFRGLLLGGQLGLLRGLLRLLHRQHLLLLLLFLDLAQSAYAGVFRVLDRAASISDHLFALALLHIERLGIGQLLFRLCQNVRGVFLGARGLGNLDRIDRFIHLQRRLIARLHRIQDRVLAGRLHIGAPG